MDQLTVLEVRRWQWLFGAKIKVLAESCSVWKLQWTIHFLALPSFLETACIPQLVGPSPIFKAHRPNLYLCHHIPLTLLPPSYIDPGDCIGPTWVIQHLLPISSFSITSAKSLLPMKDPGIKTWTFVGGPALFSLRSQLLIPKAENQNATLTSCKSPGVRHMSLRETKTH